MAVYFAGLASGFCVGWLAHLWRSQVLRARRRGGYVKPRASSIVSPQTGYAHATFSSSSPRLGLASEALAAQERRPAASSTPVPTSYGGGTDGRETGPTLLERAASAEGAELLRRNRQAGK